MNKMMNYVKLIAIFVFAAIFAAGWAGACVNAVNDSNAENYTAADGYALYSQYCASCHGKDGRASTAKGKRVGATDLTGDWNTDPVRGIRIITNGRDEMPSFKSKLKPDEIQAVWERVLKFKK